MTRSFPGVPAKVLAAMGRGLAEGTLPLEAPRLALQRLGLTREAEASAVAELRDLRAEGWNAQGIARWLGALAAERARVEGARDSDANQRSVTVMGVDVTVDAEVIVRNCVVLPNKRISADVHNEIIL